MPSADELCIVEIGPAHVEPLVALFERNQETEVAETFDPFRLTRAQAQEIALTPRNDRYFGVAWADALVAMSMLRGFDEGWEIPSLGIFVDINWQGKGTGRRLTEATIEAARELRCPAIRLTVYASNAPALHLYTSLGFEEQQRDPVDRRGGVDEKIVMRLSLETERAALRDVTP